MKLKRGETWAALQETDIALRQFPSENSEWHWRFRVLKAEVLHSQGLDHECLSLLELAVPPSLATSDLAVRRKLTQGAASASLGHLSEADKYLADAEALARANHPELLGEVSLRKGTLSFLKDDTAAAEAAYRNALKTAREQKDPFLEASALSGLGAVATKDGRYDESIDWNRAAAELARSVSASASLAKILGNMGWSYAELGDYQNALKFYKQAEEVSVKSSLLTDQTYWLTGIAYAYQGLRDDSASEAILKQALQLARTQDDKGTLAQCLTQLAWIALRTGRGDLAEQYNHEVSTLEIAGIGSRLAIDSMLLRGATGAARRNYAEAEKTFREVIGKPQASKFQQWKAHAQLAKVYADEGQSAKAEKEFRRSLETMEVARASVQAETSRLFFLSNTIIFYSNFVEFLISRHRVEDALQVVELSRARTLTEGLSAVAKIPSFPLVDFHPCKTARRRNAVLLVYWLASRESYLWVITPKKISFFTIPKDSEIEPLANDYWSEVQSGKETLNGGNLAGRRLYGMLVAPAKQMIPQNARVIVVPDTSLNRLNFETLIASEPKLHYWIEDVTLSTASSLKLLEHASTRPATKGKSLLLVGNTEQPNADFPALAQAPVEMQKIEQYFQDPSRRVLEGKQATPSAYLSSSPERFSYLHFVTHGTASLTHPLESAVILSKEGDSYKLYARDIVQHHLTATLVTISACNGAGTPYSGEGLVGLSWAFLRAGAHNVIAALWEVSDVSTPQLMDSLYRELGQGKDPAEALRDAKLSMLHSTSNTVFKKPFYWAPFQLYAGS